MSLYPYVNTKVDMDGITGTSSSIESPDPDHVNVLTYTVLKDSTDCNEENALSVLETSGDLSMDEVDPRKKSFREKKPATKKTWRGRLLPTDEKPWRKQKFIDKWIDDIKFKGWLARHPEDPTLARCISCNQELVAGKSELIKHSQTRKHVKSLQGFDASNIELERSPAKSNQPMLVWVLNDQDCPPATTEVKVNKM